MKTHKITAAFLALLLTRPLLLHAQPPAPSTPSTEKKESAVPADQPSASATPAPDPSWTNTEGKTILARFVRLEDGAVVIFKEGTEFTIPFFKLRQASVEQARALAARAAVSPDGTTLEEWHVGHDPVAFSRLPAAQAKLDRARLDLNLLSAAITHATNEARLREGLPPLKYSAALRSCALGHSAAMSSGGFFSHDNPVDSARRTMGQRFSAAGIASAASAENISSLGTAGHTYLSYAASVVDQWLKSPGHRANLLSQRYRFIGCAAFPCRCPQFHLLATQDFADTVPVEADQQAPQASALAPPPPPGQAMLSGGRATAPDGAPETVLKAVAAGNNLQTKGYKFGGGRDPLEDTGYDCSGTVSYVLIKAGLLDEPLTSATFDGYGEPGAGRWITIYVTPGHVFMTICGLRLDTGGRGGRGSAGPRWSSQQRPDEGWILRHPPGF